jgi:murein DD-endopeptidase MepM/ murein hydrolase activator NlpD
VASVHKYKRVENNIVRKVKNLAAAIGRGISSFFVRMFKAATHRYTVMLIPHSEKKVYNLHISVLSVVCVCLIMLGILGAFVWYGVGYSDTRSVLANKDNALRDTQANLDELRSGAADLFKSAKGFEAALNQTLQNLGLNRDVANSDQASLSSDLSSFLAINESADGTLKEVSDINQLARYLNDAVVPVEEIGDLINSQNALLTDIPSMWPIRGGIGHVSMLFGQNPNPFTGQYYIHKGIDLSTYRQGDPIIATADGQVVTVDIDLTGFGNYVIIKHKHGFYTRYAHLQSFAVTTGQRVQQGQVIGRIGNTGLSTGPHLHYEVHIGSDVVDPLKYINIRSDIANSPALR